eukprot:jgi/Botrbrau1/4054/Bobra.152_3s0011.1
MTVRMLSNDFKVTCSVEPVTELRRPVRSQATQTHAGTAASGNKESLWQRVLRMSIFEFASPKLEAGYQSTVAKGVGTYWLGFAPFFIVGWFQVFSRTRASILSGNPDLPPGFIPSILYFLVPSLVLYGLICLRFKSYTRHWRSIHTIWMMVHIFSTYPFQKVCLWQHACMASGICSGSGSQKQQSWSQVFAVENFYLTTICLRVIVFSGGQLPDFFFTTLSLLLSMSGNGALCEIPGREWVTCSPPMPAVAERSSAWLLAMLPPNALWGRVLSPSELSCPAVLGFWQVVGWWCACMLILVQEILSRRAYLKASLACLGPSMSVKVAWWPFGNAVLLHKLICVFFAVCYAPVILWALALRALQ